MDIIDTHVHFYDPTRPEGIPWPREDDALLYRRVLPADYRALDGAGRVTGVVIVEASPWLEDNQWLLDMTERDGLLLGVVGRLDWSDAAFDANVARFATSSWFKGVRIGGGELAKLDANRRQSAAALLAENELAVDVLAQAGDLDAAASAASDTPDATFVINHLGHPKLTGKQHGNGGGDSWDGWHAWRDGITKCAAQPNVVCKISGLVEATGMTPAPTSLEGYRDVLDALLTAFGGDRLMYGSNWPVSERFAPLATTIDLVEQWMTAADLSADVRSAIMATNARSTYRL